MTPSNVSVRIKFNLLPPNQREFKNEVCKHYVYKKTLSVGDTNIHKQKGETYTYIGSHTQML